MNFTIKNGYFNYPNPDEHSWKGFIENDMEEIRSTINEFPEVKELFSDRYNKGWTEYDKYFIYYELDIKNLRKLKLESLTDKNSKKRLKKLQGLLSNEKFIKVSENVPDFSAIGSSTGTSGKSKEDAKAYEKLFNQFKKELMEE